MSAPGGSSESGDDIHRQTVEKKRSYPKPPPQEYVAAAYPSSDSEVNRPAPPPASSDDDLEKIYGGHARHHHEHAGAPVASGDNLESLYISRDRVRMPGAPEFTIEEGIPKPSPTDWTPLFRLLTLLLFLAVGVLSVTLIHLPVVDSDGADVRMPLYQWIVVQVTMPAEQREIQNVPPQERPYELTRLRIRTVYEAVQRFELHEGAMPDDVSNLVYLEYIEPEQSLDGWGGRFLIEGRGRTMTLRSNGQDRISHTEDDLVMSDDGLALPASWAERIY